jgi:hypothetical protein
MTAEAEISKPIGLNEQTESNKPKQERERSTIEFPYLSLDVGMEIAKAVHATGGTHASWDLIAAHMGESATGGAFRNKVTTARQFGLATSANGVVTLTSIGARLSDPDQEKAAKAEAFLQVPLYKRLYDDFKGLVLPATNTGLETVIENLGVSAKQKDKARQAFQRSAKEAGFFAYGASKLVYPVLGPAGNSPKPKDKEDPPLDPPKGGNGGGGDGGNQHPLIEGLLKELPEPKTEWAMEERKNWLEMASTIFNVIYKNSDDSRGSLRVVVEKGSAK